MGEGSISPDLSSPARGSSSISENGGQEGANNPSRRSFFKKGIALGVGLAMRGISVFNVEANTPTPDKPKVIPTVIPTVDPLATSKAELAGARAKLQALTEKAKIEQEKADIRATEVALKDKIDVLQGAPTKIPTKVPIPTKTDSEKATAVADEIRLKALAERQASIKATATREAEIKAINSDKANIKVIPTVAPTTVENPEMVTNKDKGWAWGDIAKGVGGVIGGGLAAWGGLRFLKGIVKRGRASEHSNNENGAENDASENGVNDGNYIDGEFIILDPKPPTAAGPGGTT